LILIDSNIVIDLNGNDPKWAVWSERNLIDCYMQYQPSINPVIFAEVSQRFSGYETARRFFDQLAMPSLPFDDEAGFYAGQAYADYRKRGGTRSVILADFFIGGHALALKCPILTRDASRYLSYFPTLNLITPETHP
jgi:predicted nucleic acid-binding protein